MQYLVSVSRIYITASTHPSCRQCSWLRASLLLNFRKASATPLGATTSYFSPGQPSPRVSAFPSISSCSKEKRRVNVQVLPLHPSPQRHPVSCMRMYTFCLSEVPRGSRLCSCLQHVLEICEYLLGVFLVVLFEKLGYAPLLGTTQVIGRPRLCLLAQIKLQRHRSTQIHLLA